MLAGYNLDFRTTKRRVGRESPHLPRGWFSESETPVDRQGFEGQPFQVEKQRLRAERTLAPRQQAF